MWLPLSLVHCEFVNVPNVAFNSTNHRGSHPKRLVNSHKVLVDILSRQRVVHKPPEG